MGVSEFKCLCSRLQELFHNLSKMIYTPHDYVIVQDRDQVLWD